MSVHYKHAVVIALGNMIHGSVNHYCAHLSRRKRRWKKKGTTMLLKIQVTGIYFHNIGVTLSGPGIKIKVKVDEQLLRKHSSPRGFRYRHV